MIPPTAPIVRTGPDGFDAETCLPLAGSRLAWFSALKGPDGGMLPASALGDDRRETLSAPRPDLCGCPLDRPVIMGILNVTPDSFSDGGDFQSVSAAVAQARAMAGDVGIIDIGGESTRPGADEVPVPQEIARVVPVIRAIRDAGITTPISIDTRKSAVAAAALDAGADMINDVAAGRFDPEILVLAGERGVPICLMHSLADPKTMQSRAKYGDVVAEVFEHLAARIAAAEAAGVARSRVIADPGIGFGKTLQHNLSLLRDLARYHDLGVPLLVGASRKRFIGEIGAAAEAKDRLGGSIAVALYAADRGAHILRVHDTEQTRQAISLHLALHERDE